MSDDSGLLERVRALGKTNLLQARRDAQGILSASLAQARQFFGCEAGYLFLSDGRSLSLAVAQNDRAAGSDLAKLTPAPIPLTTKTLGAPPAQHDEVLAADDAHAIGGELRYDSSFDGALGLRSKAVLVIPIPGAGGRPQGVIKLTDTRDQVLPPGTPELARAMAAQAGIALSYARDLARIDSMHWETICQVGGSGEYEDEDAKWHVRRVSGYCHVLAKAAGLPAAQVEQIRFASPLHDLGKIAIPPEILYKPGKLTDEEFKRTQSHTELGWKMLKDSDSPTLRMASEIAHAHHERWDGSGYPRGLLEDAIPITARIMAVADVFDALTTRRVYKPALGIEQSLKILTQESGKHFDPTLIEAFQGVFSQILEIKRAWTPDSG